MAADGTKLFSREEVMGGLPARRAGLLLYAIQSRTAQLVDRSRRAMATYLTERSAAEHEREFLAALAAGRALPITPSIQDIERYAERWATLVPTDPSMRAAVARLMAKEYRFPREAVPSIRAALGLDTPEVQAAYERFYEEPLGAIYTPRLELGERAAWLKARAAYRLEHLPPFWTAFSLTLTECVGAGILALPIALGAIGPIGAVILLVAFGLVNVLTLSALVEAITRNGAMRYGSSYFGRLVRDYLGLSGTALMTGALFVLNAALFLVALIGFGSVLEGATGVSLAIWAGLLFLVNLAYLRREGLDATVASALVIGAVNIVLILAISGIAFAHIEPGRFSEVRVPLLDGRPVDTSVLALIFGVVLLAYFGHTSAGNAAKVVLARDPGGRALLWGNAAAMLAATALYALATLAIMGAVPAGALEGSSGTALTPLAERTGVAVDVLGSLFAVLAVGLGSVYASLGLYNQMVEWLPLRRQGRRSRFALGVLPAAAMLVVALLLIHAGRDSFAAPLGYVGALTIPLLGGIFPMLMVAAARRRGERVPGKVVGALGHPAVIAPLSLLFLAGVVLHGTSIWDDPLAQAAALAVAGTMCASAWFAWRGGAFQPRAVVELRGHPEGSGGSFLLTAAGRPVSGHVELEDGAGTSVVEGDHGNIRDFAGLRTAGFELHDLAVRELKLWVHQETPEGDSDALDATVEITVPGAQNGAGPTAFHGELVLPAPTAGSRVVIAAKGSRAS